MRSWPTYPTVDALSRLVVGRCFEADHAVQPARPVLFHAEAAAAHLVHAEGAAGLVRVGLIALLQRAVDGDEPLQLEHARGGDPGEEGQQRAERGQRERHDLR